MGFKIEWQYLQGDKLALAWPAPISLSKKGQFALFGRRRDPPLNQTTAEIGKDALTVYGDIIKEDDVQTLVEKTFLRLGGIDISTNNEGSFLSLPFHEISEEQ